MVGESAFGIDPTVVDRLALQIKRVADHGVETAIVIGGEISGEEFRRAVKAWIVPPITWAWWQPCSMHLPSRTR